MKRKRSPLFSERSRRMFNRGYGLGAAVFTAGQLASVARKAWRAGSRTATTTKRKYSGGGVATAQKDVKVQYVARRQNRGVRRRQIKKYRSWVGQQLKQLATKTVHFNDAVQAQMSLPDVNQQNYAICHLYANNGGNTIGRECGARDIKQIRTNDPEIAVNSGKVYFDTATMDITMSNTSEPEEGDPRSAQIEVDVYDVVYRDDCSYTYFINMVNDAELKTDTIGTGSSLSLQNRGATLFEFPELIKFAKMKILKKTKIILPPNQDATFRITDRRNRTYDTNEIGLGGDKQGFVLRGATRSLIFVAKATVGDASALAGTMTLRIGCTRTYKYKNLTAQVTKDSLLPS